MKVADPGDAKLSSDAHSSDLASLILTRPAIDRPGACDIASNKPVLLINFVGHRGMFTTKSVQKTERSDDSWAVHLTFSTALQSEHGSGVILLRKS